MTMTTPAPTPPKKSKYSRLSTAQWEQVVVLWELGTVTLKELSEMFSIGVDSLRIGLKKRGAKKGARAHEIGAATLEASKTDTQKQIELIADTKERYLGYTTLLSKLVMKEVTDAARDKKPMAMVKDNLTSLQKAANTLATLRDENYHLLGLYDEDAITKELPELGITEYTPEEIEQIQRGFEVVDETEDDEYDEFEVELPDFEEPE